MKKLMALSFIACLFTTLTMAQDGGVRDTIKKMENRRGGWRGKGKMKDLNLSPEQEQKIKEIRQAGKPNSAEERAAQEAKINEILTPEQRVKMEQMKKLRAEKRNNDREEKAE
jgi:Spy/CpxP family protein refolding chaperone